MKLTQDQLEALDMIETSTGPVRLLGGPGVGKSTVIDHLKGRFLKVAPTNKAATIIGGQTLHKLLGLKMQRKGNKLITVPTRKTPMMPLRDRIVLDEASCLSRELLDKYVLPLLPHAIFVGDEAQLNPVNETSIPFMDLDLPTKSLEYVHRFGGELLEVAYDMRKCVFDSKRDFKVPLHWAIEIDEMISLLKDEDVIIAYKNTTVNAYNDKVRMHRFGTTDWRVGEKVRIGSAFLPLMLPTESEHFITKIDTTRKGGYKCWVIDLGTCQVPVIHEESKEDYDQMLQDLVQVKDWRRFYALKDGYCDLRPSYAITAHKSQGSTYNNSFIDYADIFTNKNSNEAVRAAYVATTRSRNTSRNLL